MIIMVVLLSVAGLAKPTVKEAGEGKQEFKFVPHALPSAEVESGSAEVKGKNGNVSISTTDEAATVVFTLEELEPGGVIKILGSARLSEGEVQVYLEVDKKKRNRLRLSKAGQVGQVNFSASLPKGEARLVVQLKPRTSLSFQELSVERLI